LEEGKHHEVQGTVAIVTGGNGGLGQRICHALAQAGSHIAVVYTQSQAQAQEVAGQLRQTGVQAEAMAYNVPGRSVWSSEPACSLLHPRSSPARAPGGLPSYRPLPSGDPFRTFHAIDQSSVLEWNIRSPIF
jgi:hypothetical protein